MTGFSDRFGGTQIQPAAVEFRNLLNLSADLALAWPQFSTDPANVAARSMNVITTLAGVDISLPDAREATPGEDFVFYNSGAYAYALKGSAGAAIATIQPGERRLVVLSDNSTEDGTWIVTLLGVGIGTLDVAAAAGAGLRAIGTLLNVALQTQLITSSRAIAASDRATVMVWTGGTGTLTLPLSSDVPSFNVEIRNQGTGALTVNTTGGELVDGVSSLTFNASESAALRAGTGSWYSVGRGRSAQFNFSQLNKTLSGGTTTLSLTEAANVIQTYTGTLIANVDVVLPAVVQVYYVSNQTTGAFNVRFKNPATGLTVSIPQGQNAVLISDGTNVINGSTTVAGIGAITFGAGTVSTPSVQIGAVNTGFFSPSAGVVGFSSGGVQTFSMSSTGAAVALATNAVLGVSSTGGTAFLSVSRPAGTQGGVQINTVNTPRWIAGVDSAAESGANAGSNFVVQRFDDSGTLIDTPIAVARATGAVAMSLIVGTNAVLTNATITNLSVGSGGAKDSSLIGEVRFMAGPDTLVPANHIQFAGQLLNRVTYAALWAYAQTTTPVSEATWAASNQGKFSVGDGSTTFRVPDLRAMVIRGLDSGRGVDTGRIWGSFQDQLLLSHTHTATDSGHGHTVNDPSHQHAGSTDVQGNHQHTYTTPSTATFIAAPGGVSIGYVTGFGSNGTSVDGNHAHNVTTDFRFTGVTINTGAASITVAAAGGAENRVKNIAYPAFGRYQ